MLPIVHIIISAIFSFLALFFYNDYLFWALFFLSAVLIDFDHYLYYVYKKRDLSLPRAYEYHKYILEIELDKGGQKEILMIFHTIEFFIVLLILSILFSFLWPIFFGCLFHEAIDLGYGTTQKDKKYKRAFSLIHYVIKSRGK